ncbi:DNA-processing protein DprA [Oceaniserpentilla sp. 4NH20-0058]|uniref:DNA-processing protein DprA n=1 Tax=Oceaniserpentilla sp. 4NH20-0058 TaxID=3127660 RepID=UPI0031038C8F
MDRTTQKEAWINLALVPGLGPKFFQKLFEQNVTAQMVYQYTQEQQTELGINKSCREFLLQHPPNKPAKAVEQALNWQLQANQYLLTSEDEAYPEKLKQIASVPPLLFVKGNIDILSLEQVALVGSRYPTSSGGQQAYDFANELATAGLVITSGLAKGVDALAHQGALDAQGATIAVLGTGIDKIYPKSHARLAEDIAQNGALVSEFPLGAPAMKGHFPRRNRIVSGMSLGVLVIEATLKSGSLITARQALEQNREVMAVPGAIHNPQKAGCHYLIRQGARLIETSEQVLEELNPMVSHDGGSKGSKSIEQFNSVQSNLQGDQLKVFNALDYDGLDMDSLVSKTQLNVSELSMVLMEMELAGLLNQEQGMYMKS